MTRRVRPSVVRPGILLEARSRGRKILDRQARKYLGISGEEFARRERAGELEGLDHAEVARIAMLLPYARRSSLLERTPSQALRTYAKTLESALRCVTHARCRAASSALGSSAAAR